MPEGKAANEVASRGWPQLVEVLESSDVVEVLESSDVVEVLESSDELLWRNAHPSWIQEGRPTSQLFRPMGESAVDHQLSTAREKRVSARDHYREYVAMNLESGGVWGVSVNEVQDEGLQAIYDEFSDLAPDPCPSGHAYIDFVPLLGLRTQLRKIASRLAKSAHRRGCAYKPGDD